MSQNSADPAPPVLRQFACLWTLEHHPSAACEWTLEDKIRQAKARGFDAVGGGPLRETADLCRAQGMDFVAYIDAGAETWRDRLKLAVKVSPARVNVQLGNHDTPPSEAAELWVRMEEGARELGLNVDLEVHRDTATETPEKVDEIAERYHRATGAELRLCYDFSHYAVVKHLCPPYAERLLERPGRIQLARQIHLRPFNGHHAQVPATDGHGNETPEFIAYLDFVDALFACWLKGEQAGAVLYVCPEYGPAGSGYALSNAPDVWEDAVHLRARTAEIWRRNLAAWRVSEGR